MTDKNFVIGYVKAKLEQLYKVLKELEDEHQELTRVQIVNQEKRVYDLGLEIEFHLSKVDRDEEINGLYRLHENLMNSVELNADLRMNMLRKGRKLNDAPQKEEVM